MCAKHLLSSASALIDNTMPHPRHLHRRLAAHNGQPKQGGAMYRPATFGLCLPDRRVRPPAGRHFGVAPSVPTISPLVFAL